MYYSKLNKEQAIAKIKKDSLNLYYLSENFKDDKDIVLEAVNNHACALEYASERLKDDKILVLIAVKQYTFSLFSASEILQNDKELLEILEKEDTSSWNIDYQKWYKDRMEVLGNIREKELVKSLINTNNKSNKKLKF